MALIGEMQYLTIGGNTYSLPVGGGGTVTSVAVSNATNGGLSISGSPISSSGTITIGHSNVLSSAQTTQAVYPITIDKNGHISGYGTAVTIPDVSGKVNIEETNGETTTNVIRENGGIELQAWGDGASTALGIYPGVISLDTEIDSGGYPGIYLSKTNREIVFQRGTIRYAPTGSNYSYTITGAPTAARTLTLPNATGTVALTSDIPDISGKIDTAGTGLSKSGTTLNHSNSVTAQTTQAVYPIKIDAQGHISDYGTAINLEDTKVFLVTITQNGDDDDYVSDKTAEEIFNAYNAGRIIIAKTDDFILPLVVIGRNPYIDYYYAAFAYVNAGSYDPIHFSSDKIEIETSNGITTVNYVILDISAASYVHTHGNITNGGDITTTTTIANGDRLVINDESASKITNSSITFGSSTSQYLANNGTWQNVPSVPTKTSDLTNDSGFINSIKTINNQSLIGSGDITVSTTAAQIIRWTESA